MVIIAFNIHKGIHPKRTLAALRTVYARQMGESAFFLDFRSTWQRVNLPNLIARNNAAVSAAKVAKFRLLQDVLEVRDANMAIIDAAAAGSLGAIRVVKGVDLTLDSAPPKLSAVWTSGSTPTILQTTRRNFACRLNDCRSTQQNALGQESIATLEVREALLMQLANAQIDFQNSISQGYCVAKTKPLSSVMFHIHRLSLFLKRRLKFDH